jgi:transposase
LREGTGKNIEPSFRRSTCRLIEAMFCRLKDFRRVVTRYDKLAANLLSAAELAAVVAFWP